MPINGYSRPGLGSPAGVDGAGSSFSKWLEADVYARIIRGVEEETQASSRAPSLQAIRLCVLLYFERLHPNFPFVKQNSLSIREAALDTFAGSGRGRSCLFALLGRLTMERHFDASTRPDSITRYSEPLKDVLPLIQAKVLHLLCMLHSSRSYIAQRAVFERADLVQWFSFLNLVPDYGGVSGLSTSCKDIQLWIMEQSSLRTGMLMWVSGIAR
jgi:hypothetical protein